MWLGNLPGLKVSDEREESSLLQDTGTEKERRAWCSYLGNWVGGRCASGGALTGQDGLCSNVCMELGQPLTFVRIKGAGIIPGSPTGLFELTLHSLNSFVHFI